MAGGRGPGGGLGEFIIAPAQLPILATSLPLPPSSPIPCPQMRVSSHVGRDGGTVLFPCFSGSPAEVRKVVLPLSLALSRPLVKCGFLASHGLLASSLPNSSHSPCPPPPQVLTTPHTLLCSSSVWPERPSTLLDLTLSHGEPCVDRAVPTGDKL